MAMNCFFGPNAMSREFDGCDSSVATMQVLSNSLSSIGLEMCAVARKYLAILTGTCWSEECRRSSRGKSCR